MMKACGISEVLIVIGNLGYAIVNALGDGSHRDLITKIEPDPEAVKRNFAVIEAVRDVGCTSSISASSMRSAARREPPCVMSTRSPRASNS